VIEFACARMNIEDQKFRTSEKYGHHGRPWGIVGLFLVGTSSCDFASQ
jgi:hypothetical protein